jgi:hypothetical protein
MGRYDFLLNADKSPQGTQDTNGQHADQAIAQRSPLSREDGQDNVTRQPVRATQQATGKSRAQSPQTRAITKASVASVEHVPLRSEETPASRLQKPDAPPRLSLTLSAPPTPPAAGTDANAETPRNHGTMEPHDPDGTSTNTVDAVDSVNIMPSQRFQFDVSARADHKYTLAFTDEELEALEDVKLELRRRYDVKTTKTELVRCGLWDLIEDYARHGEQSRVLQRLRARAPRSQQTMEGTKTSAEQETK